MAVSMDTGCRRGRSGSETGCQRGLSRFWSEAGAGSEPAEDQVTGNTVSGDGCLTVSKVTNCSETGGLVAG